MVGDSFVGGDGNDWEIWAFGGHSGGGGARSGLTDDNIGVDFFGEPGGGSGNGAIDAAIFFLGNGGNARMILGIENDLFHFFDGFDWIRTVGGFIGKHDDVGALDDGGGDVGDFGAGRFWGVHHARKHLGGDDAKFAIGATERNEFSLDDWHDFGASFDSHVAAGNHDAVSGSHDGLKIFVRRDGLFGFNFSDDLGGATIR